MINHILAAALAGAFSIAGIAIFLRWSKRTGANMVYGVFVCATLVFGLLNSNPDRWRDVVIGILIVLGYGLATSFVCVLCFPSGWRWHRLILLPRTPFALSLVASGSNLLVSLLLPREWGIVLLTTQIFTTICMCLVTANILFGVRRLPISEQPLAGMTLIGIVFVLLSFAVVNMTPRLTPTFFTPAIANFIVFYTFFVIVVALFAGIIVWSLRWLAVRAWHIMLVAVVACVLLLLLLLLDFAHDTNLEMLRSGLVALMTYRLTQTPLLFLPLICCYTLMHQQLSGKASLLSRRFIRSILWFSLACCFGLAAFITSLLAERLFSDHTIAILVAFCWFFLSVGLFPQAWHRVRALGDHMFYHDFYHYNRTLRDLSRELTRLRDLDEICAFLLPRLTTLLNCCETALLIYPGYADTEYHWHSYHYATAPPGRLQERFSKAAHLAISKEFSYEPLYSEGIIVLPLYENMVLHGCLCIGPKLSGEPYSRQDKSFLATLAAQLAVLEANARYLDQVRANAHQLAALNHRVVSAQEDERRRLALELHDDVLQQAMLLVRQLSDAGTMTEVATAMPLARSLVSGLRNSCLQLRPPLLDELGLPEALRWLTQQTAQRGKLRVELHCSGDFNPRPPAQAELALYRVTQEALTNVIKHAEASCVTVRLRASPPGEIILLIADNGQGMEQNIEQDMRQTVHAESLGMAGMAERMAAIHGTLHLRSHSGRGVVLRARYRPTGQRPPP